MSAAAFHANYIMDSYLHLIIRHRPSEFVRRCTENSFTSMADSDMEDTSDSDIAKNVRMKFLIMTQIDILVSANI